jgi:hypothetical protein
MTNEAKVKTAKDAALEALAILGGFMAGNVAMGLAEKVVPEKLKMAVPLIGAVGLEPHFSKRSDIAKMFGNGMLVAGTSDLLKKATEGRGGIVGKINGLLPGRGTALLGFYPSDVYPVMNGFGSPTTEDEFLLNGPAPAVPMLDEYLSA